jgi:glycosyltransferase involved in cell wall biosynthesis
MTTNSIDQTISVVVPALNEEANIALAVREIIEALGQAHFSDWEIVLVNDGSTDRTASVMERLATENPRIRVVHNGSNLGFGGAYKSGLAAATLEYVIMVPGDNELPATGLLPILEAVGKADIVVPYWINTETRSWLRRLASYGFTAIMNVLFGLRLKYYNGTAVHRTKLVRQITINSNGFDYQAEALIKLLRRGCSYVQVGTSLGQRRAGTSKALRPKNVIIVLTSIARLFRECR